MIESLKKFLEEQIRHRFAPESKLGADNWFISKIFDINSHDVEDVEGMLRRVGSVFNPNLKLLNVGLNEIEPYDIIGEKYPPFVLKKGFYNYMKEAGINGGYFSTYFGGKQLKADWKKMVSAELDIVVIGYGGAMSNILYNLVLLGDAFDIRTPFASLKIFEDDNWSFTNILRVSKPVMHRAFSKYQINQEGERATLKKTLILDEELNLAESSEIFNRRFGPEDIEKIMKQNPDTIFIGAPDFETRKVLEEKGANFIMIGHSGNRIRLTKSPVIHAGVEETYGTIDVPVLLCNLWVATYKLVELLKDGTSVIESLEKGEEIYEFDFDQLTEETQNNIKKKFKEER